MTPVLKVDQLCIPMGNIRNVSFDIMPGEIVALVGQSGSGKSLTAKAIMGLIPHESGEITPGLKPGRDIGIVFQDPQNALNPTMKIGTQLIEGLLYHKGLTQQEALLKAERLLDQMGFHHPKQVLAQYPFELSGGMRQRILIAMAISCDPKLLIADEPTTALDVTVQADILALLKALNIAILLITHDLSIVSGFCSRVLVMYEGLLVENQPVASLFTKPQHSHTQELLAHLP